MIKFFEQDKHKHLVLKHVGQSISSYYYSSVGTNLGKKKSRFVYDIQDNKHDLSYVIKEIKTQLNGEFVDYGYYNTYSYLNHEKGLKNGAYRTYKHLKEYNLLKFQRSKSKKPNRNWVKKLVSIVQSEFSFLKGYIK